MPWYEDVEDVIEYKAFDTYLKQASGDRDLVAMFDLRMAHLAGAQLSTPPVFKGGLNTSRNQKVVETLFGPFNPGKPLVAASSALARITQAYFDEFKTLDTMKFAEVTEWVLKSHSIGEIEDQMRLVHASKVRALMDRTFNSFRKARAMLVTKDKQGDTQPEVQKKTRAKETAFKKIEVTEGARSDELAKLRKHTKMKLDGKMLGLRGGHLKGRLWISLVSADKSPLLLVSSEPDKAIDPRYITEAVSLQYPGSEDAVEGWYAQSKDKKKLLVAFKSGRASIEQLKNALLTHGCKPRTEITITDKRSVLEAEEGDF